MPHDIERACSGQSSFSNSVNFSDTGLNFERPDQVIKIDKKSAQYHSGEIKDKVLDTEIKELSLDEMTIFLALFVAQQDRARELKMMRS